MVKVSALTQDDAPTFDDLLYLVNAPGGSPGSRSAILQRALLVNPVEDIATTTDTIATADMGKTHTLSHAASCAILIPTNAADAIRIGECLMYRVTGAGTISGYTFTADTGVTLDGVSAGSCGASAAQKAIVLTKIGTDAWNIDGAVGAVA